MKDKKFAIVLLLILTILATAVSMGSLIYSAMAASALTKALQTFAVLSGMGAAGCLYVLVCMIINLFERGAE